MQQHKGLANATPGDGYDVLSPNGNGRLGPWPPSQKSDGKRMMVRKSRDVEVLCGVLLRDYEGSCEDKSGRVMTKLLAQINKRDDTPWSVARLISTVCDGVALGLATVDVNVKRTYAIRLTVTADELPFELPFAKPPKPVEDDGAAARRERERQILERADEREQSGKPDKTTYADPAYQEYIEYHNRTGDPDVPQPEIEYAELAVSLLNEVIRRATTKPDDQAEVPAYIEVERNHYRDLSTKQRERIRVLERDLEVIGGRIKTMNVELHEERRQRMQLEENLKSTMETAHAYRERLGDLIDDDTKRALDSIMRTAPGFEAYARVNGQQGPPKVLTGVR